MKFKKLGIAMLAYAMVISIIPIELTANASTGVKDFRGQHESGYISNVVYRDNGDVQLSYDNLVSGVSGDYYIERDILTKNEVSSSGRISKEEVIEYEDKIGANGEVESLEVYIKNLKTNKRYNAYDLKLNLEKLVSEHYNIEPEDIWLFFIKSNNDDIFAEFNTNKDGIFKKGYISERGKIIEANLPDDYKEKSVDNKKIFKMYLNDDVYYTNGYIVDYHNGYPIIFNENGDVLKIIEHQYLVGVFEDKITTRNTDYIRNYRVKNNEVELIEEVKVNNLEHYWGNITLDSKGEVWVIQDGNIYIIKNSKLELRYKVDKYANSIKVYDENNMIVDTGAYWYFNSNLIISDGKVSTPYRREKINGKEYLYNIKNELQKGWKNVGGKDYYFDSNGVMQKNKWIGDYYVGADGVCYYNKWVGDYYCGADGRYVRNAWIGDYYCGTDGRYVRNAWIGDYYCGTDGRYVRNAWIGDYYCGADGRYVRNAWIGDYYCGTDGRYVRNGWIGDYYCGADGRYVRNGWISDYYCGADGRYVRNGWIGDYYCGADGRYVKDSWVKTGGNWYYCSLDGRYLKNTSQKIGNKIYKFNTSGICINP